MTSSTAPAVNNECYYCGTNNPINPTVGCPQRNGENPCVPGRLFMGSTPEVRKALREAGLR